MMGSCNIFTREWINGNGNIRTEKRNTGNFSSVLASGSIDVEIKSGQTYSVSVEDDDNVLPYIVTEVDGEKLNIHYKEGTSIQNDHVKVYVTAPSIDKLDISGSGNITSMDTIKNQQEIKLNVSGSGDIKAIVDAPSVRASINGSGNISLSGRTRDFSCSSSGSGDLDCGSLQSENTKVEILGSGNAHVFASVHLSASTLGSGDIFYRGNPSNPEIHASGSGSVQAEK